MNRTLMLIGMALFGLVTLSGCARLTVQVDVMNPVYAKQAASDAAMRVEAQRMAEGDSSQSRALVQAQFQIYRDFRAKCLTEAAAFVAASPDDAPILAGTNPPKKADQDFYLDRINDPVVLARIERERAAKQKELLEADRRIADVVIRSGGYLPATVAVSEDFVKAWSARNEAIEQIRSLLNERVRDAAGFCKGAASSARLDSEPAASLLANIESDRQQAEGQVGAAATKTITGDGRLLGDLYEAYYVTKAPEEMWAPRFNRAFGQGFGGSTSIAVIMNKTADFSIKGFVFDGRSTAEMMRKVSVQAVALLAAAHGAPSTVRPASGANAASLGVDTTKMIADAQTKQFAAAANDAAYRAFLFRIADSILSDYGALTDPKGDAARTRVKETFDAHKGTFDLATPAPK